MAKKTIGDVYDIVVEIQNALAARSHYDSDVQSHQVAIKGDGNGKLGLETRMALTEEREQKRDRREWFIYTVMFAEMAALIFTMVSS